MPVIHLLPIKDRAITADGSRDQLLGVSALFPEARRRARRGGIVHGRGELRVIALPLGTEEDLLMTTRPSGVGIDRKVPSNL